MLRTDAAKYAAVANKCSTVNTLSLELQARLRKRQYPFPKADAFLKTMNNNENGGEPQVSSHGWSTFEYTMSLYNGHIVPGK